MAVEVEASRLVPEVPAGEYAFAAEVWRFDGARREETIRASFVPMTGKDAISGEMAFDVLNSLRSQAGDWIDANQRLPDRIAAADRLEEAKGQLLRQFREARTNYEAENADRIRIQRESLARALKRRVDKLQQSIFLVTETRRASIERDRGQDQKTAGTV